MADNGKSNEPLAPPYLTTSKPQAYYAAYQGHRPFYVVALSLKPDRYRFEIRDSPELRADLLALERGEARVEPNRYGRIIAELNRVIREELRSFERQLSEQLGSARGWGQIRTLQAEMELRAAEDRAASLSARAERWISSTEHITTENPDDAA